ncbi:MAG TPA: putative lipid II flippase FtsW [Actinomycetota bacterium]|nr:putative lipid II flippase FtsW [Actinomycetota bacterium]
MGPRGGAIATRSEAVASTGERRGRHRMGGQQLHLGEPAVLIGVTTAALLVLGLTMILSASSVASFATYGSSFMFFKRQLVWALIGIGVFVTLARVDYRRTKGLGYPLFLISAVLLAAVLVPGIGIVAGGSARWIGLGPFSFQPSEVAKLALVVFCAEVFARKQERSLREFAHTALPLLPALGILTLLVMLQPDLGTTLLLGAIGVGMLFVAGAPLAYVIPLSIVGAAAATVAALSEDYRRARILAFLDPWKDPLNTGYQTIQSLIALGSGGWFGVGLGASRQKWMYIPNAHTDFIYAILGEEMGLLGTLAVLGMFAFLTYLGAQTARRAPDRYGTLLASGITVWIAVQGLVNMGAVTAALPITGVPLPLVSFGGTSLVVSLAAMGILANIASLGRRPGRSNRVKERASARR